VGKRNCVLLILDSFNRLHAMVAKPTTKRAGGETVSWPALPPGSLGFDSPPVNVGANFEFDIHMTLSIMDIKVVRLAWCRKHH
jgi:hypothetical protein